MMTPGERRGGPGACPRPSSPSSLSWISCVLLAMQEQAAGRCRIRSRPEIALPSTREQRRGQAHHPGDRGQQQPEPRDHRQRQAPAPRPLAVLLAQLPRQDRDEDDVVDAEDDLEHRQRQQGDPALGARHPVEHRGSSPPPRLGRLALAALRQRAPGLRVLPQQRGEIQRDVLAAGRLCRCVCGGLLQLLGRRRSAFLVGDDAVFVRHAQRVEEARPSSAAGARGDRRSAAARPPAPTPASRPDAATFLSSGSATTDFGAELDALRDAWRSPRHARGWPRRRARTRRRPAACARRTVVSTSCDGRGMSGRHATRYVNIAAMPTSDRGRILASARRRRARGSSMRSRGAGVDILHACGGNATLRDVPRGVHRR